MTLNSTISSSRNPIVVLVGPYTEIGGVSIHIRRITELLKEDYDFLIVNESRKKSKSSSVVNLRSYPFFDYASAFKKSSIIHIHSGKILLVILHLLFASILRKKIVVTIHSYRNPSVIFSLLLRIFQNRTIVVNKEIKESINLRHSLVLEAFIPPILEEHENIPEHILQVIKNSKSSQKTIITGNAFRVVNYNGKDLYGIDQLVELSAMLKQHKLNVLILFFISSLVNCREKYEAYQNQIKQLGLQEYIILLNEHVPFIKIIKEVDIVVRPTLQDGDALTVRESLFYNKPTIASDVVERPIGTILYEAYNVNDLFSKVVSSITTKEVNSKNYDFEVYRKRYISIYS